MFSFRELVSTFRSLDLESGPVIAHVSLSALGEVRGGVDTLLGALLNAAPALMMPSFTYKTMLTPETGPELNGMTYGSASDLNRMAEFYRKRMPADRLMGATAEALRQHPLASRSSHPILSFSGVGVQPALDAQTLEEPLAPIRVLAEQDGWVLLVGVDHTSNTSVHYAELTAGRKQFVRWALTTHGAVECPAFPGCSQGFNALEPYLYAITQSARAGNAWVRAIPIQPMIQILCDLLAADPLAFLCEQPYCERCAEVRAAVASRHPY